MRHVLVLGGARSGKTAFAEKLALHRGQQPAYMATAQILDQEMRARVARHKKNRAGDFTTIEAPLKLVPALVAAERAHDMIVVDCLTLWITNLLLAHEDVAAAIDELGTWLERCQARRARLSGPRPKNPAEKSDEPSRPAGVILVSNEVGLGIVPDNAMARTFRDLAGSTHQQLAEICDDVYFVAAGLPLTLKGKAPEF